MGLINVPLWLTNVNRLLQLGVVLHCQQRLVVASVVLQLLLSPTGCHPDLRPVLIRNSFANKPFHFPKKNQKTDVFHGHMPQRHGAAAGGANLCTCHILLHLRLLLQELGPSPGPPVEDDHVLVHHVLVGFVVVWPLKAVGVDPARIKCTGTGVCVRVCESWHVTSATKTKGKTDSNFCLSPHPSLSLLFPDDGHDNSEHWLRFPRRGDQMPQLNDQPVSSYAGGSATYKSKT